MDKILILTTIIFGLSALYGLFKYAPRFFAWFGCSRPQKKYISTKNNKIALIIPARNESVAIKMLLESAKKQTYPREFFDLHVVVKQPDDPTIALVEAYGGYTYVDCTQNCKGDALDFCLKTIINDEKFDYDAYLIIDADCMMADTYLEEMNNSLASGRQIVLSKKLVKNYLMDKSANSLASSCNGLIWTIIDELGNRYKSDHGITIMTIGTGLMLRSDVINELGGWPYRATLTEDIELMYDCVVKGYTTLYYSYAVLYVEESPSLKVTNKRRNRWLNGVVNSKRVYAKKLKSLPKTPEIKRNLYFTCALEPVYWYVATLTFYCLSQVVTAFVLFLTGNNLWAVCIFSALIGFGILYLSFFILTAACLIIERKTIRLSFIKRLMVLFAHPIFYMGYIPIIAEAFITRNGRRGWEVIDRLPLGEEEPLQSDTLIKK